MKNGHRKSIARARTIKDLCRTITYIQKALFVCLAIFTPAHANDFTSHTFFVVRPPFQRVMPEKISLFYDRMEARDGGISSALQVVPFGGKSTNQKEMARFFLPFDKSEIIAGEFNSSAILDNTIDVIANYFGVLTRPVSEVFGGAAGFNVQNLTYQSRIAFNPTQSYWGFGLNYHQKIASADDEDKGFFLNVSVPIMAVKNDVGFCETVFNKGGGTQGLEVSEGFVGTIGQALAGGTVFGNKQFKYGKISDARTKWGVADIEVSLGHLHNQGNFFRMWYGGLILPTGNKPNGEYVFEPIVGNNHHFGVLFGGEMSYEMWSNQREDRSIWLVVSTITQFLFSNVQRRSLDLVDKQWSRYMWMYENQQATASPYDITPGINVLTMNLRVTPRGAFTGTTSIVFTCDEGFIAEIGYNSWCRQSEEVELACPFDDQKAMIVGINTADTTVFASESSASINRYLLFQGLTINTNPSTNQPELIRLKENDLDFRSACQPYVISNIVYATFGYRWDNLNFPMLAGIGGSYEFSADNAGIQRWMLWGKWGMSY